MAEMAFDLLMLHRLAHGRAPDAAGLADVDLAREDELFAHAVFRKHLFELFSAHRNNIHPDSSRVFIDFTRF